MRMMMMMMMMRRRMLIMMIKLGWWWCNNFFAQSIKGFEIGLIVVMMMNQVKALASSIWSQILLNFFSLNKTHPTWYVNGLNNDVKLWIAFIQKVAHSSIHQSELHANLNMKISTKLRSQVWSIWLSWLPPPRRDRYEFTFILYVPIQDQTREAPRKVRWVQFWITWLARTRHHRSWFLVTSVN